MIRRFLLDSSISFKIIGLFLFAFLSFIGFSFYFIKDQMDRDHTREEFRYRYLINTISPIVRESKSIDAIYQYLEEFGFVQAYEPVIKEHLINTNKLPPITQGIFVKTLRSDGKIYVLLEAPNMTKLFRYSPHTSFFNFYVVIAIAIVLLVLLFIFLLKSVAPLKILHSNIKKFARGDLDISCRLEQKDEIGELAQEFDNAVAKIRALHDSRTLFLRSIMHELNTPITKGRLICAMLEDKNLEKRLGSVFERLGSLIKEFAKLEQMNAKSYKITKREFRLEEVVQEAKRMLMIENDEQILLRTQNDIIKADFDLFALVLKNLFDNAIKYGSDKKVSIGSDRQNLIVSNRGQPLKADFAEYLKPYFKENNSQGFGLGLYIIKSVLESQKFEIHYCHEEGMNHFIISGCVVENVCILPRKEKK